MHCFTQTRSLGRERYRRLRSSRSRTSSGDALGVDTCDYSFAYVARWSSGTKLVKETGERVIRGVKQILEGFEQTHNHKHWTLELSSPLEDAERQRARSL